MGKNRKARQAVNQTNAESEDNVSDPSAPVEFLTSDDFQVVQKKRHHSKKSPEDPEEREFQPRSRTSSSKFVEAEDDIGCHSGFWGVKSQICSPEDVTETITLLKESENGAETCNSCEDVIECHNGAETCNGIEGVFEKKGSQNGIGTCNRCEDVLENGGGDCLSEVCNGVKQMCINGEREEEKYEKTHKISEVFNFQCPIPIERVKVLGSGDEKETNVQDLNQSVVPKVGMASKLVTSDQKEICLSLHIDTNASDTALPSYESPESASLHIDANTSSNASPRSEDASKVSELGCHTEKNHSKKKKEKKVRDKKHSDGQRTGRVLTNSSSSDFSEVQDEKEKQDRKRPSKKQLAAIHDALSKAKDEEERRRREEEERRRLAEEAEKKAQEREKMEEEKKQKKKLKEKQKRERLKSEGRLLSKSQKASRARLAATLEAFRQQGVNVPQIGEKRPRGLPMDRNRKRLNSTQSDSGVVRQKSESLSSQESGKDSMSDLPSSFDSKSSISDLIHDFRAVEIVTTESDAGHFSCSEESDAIVDDLTLQNSGLVRSNSNVPIDNDLQTVCALPEVEKSNLAHPKSNVPNTITSDEKKDCVRLRLQNAKNNASTQEEIKDSSKLRSPVICVLGHVDTGKTKLLDFIRKTHVQDSEAGGITQQIGATMIPLDALKEKCKMVKDFASHPLKVPGLLVIDTPGHESFRNLRSRGTSVCDMAILVVDIMHGLEPQTLESIDLLKKSKIPFIVALNKVDRIYGWKIGKDQDIQDTIDKQDPSTLMEFKKRSQDIILQFANVCLNAALFYENQDPRSFVSMVPISAVTGDGMGNLLSSITLLAQSLMRRRLTFTEELQATVLEVKVIPGLGTTIDIILVNGRLQEGDTIVLVGQEGPVVTQIRSLLMPRPLRELRVKNPYIEYKSVEGAQGVKLTGKDLDRTMAGLPLFVARNPADVERLKNEASDLLNQTVSNVRTSERGVYVLASTLGSLEALLDFLTSASIPYVGVKVGPVVKRDVMKASIMLEHDKLFATILAFDVRVERDAQELADSLGVRIFAADVIYHLSDTFQKYREEFDRKRDAARHQAVFPCILQVMHAEAGAAEDPLVLEVLVEAGSLRQGTPLCKSSIDLGTVSLIEVQGEFVACAKEGQRARITLETREGACSTHLSDEDYIMSRISRQSIEACKEHYKDELNDTDWHLMSELKKMLHLHA